MNLKLLKNIILFQKRIFIISYTISIIIGGLFGGNLKSVGLSFLLISPLTHYFYYEVVNRNQYYYYYNLGISKLTLWGVTLFIALINLLIF